MKDLDPQQNASSAGGERRHGDTTYPESWATVAHALKVSAREWQVIALILEDHKESAIAVKLAISAHTVHVYLRRVFHKLHVNSRAQLVLKVLQTCHRLNTTDAGNHARPNCPFRAAGLCSHYPIE